MPGGDVPGLGTVDGDMGPESIDGEKTPLLAMLLDPSDSWLDRRGAGAKNGENRPLLEMLMLPNESWLDGRGTVGRGTWTECNGSRGVPGRRFPAVERRGGGLSGSAGRTAAGEGYLMAAEQTECREWVEFRFSFIHVSPWQPSVKRRPASKDERFFCNLA